MSTAPGKRRRKAKGASEAQAGQRAEQIRRVGARLKAEFGELIRSFPVERRVISEMSRWLGVTRPVCQRVVQAVRHRGDALEAVALLPGVQGLALFAQAAGAAGFDVQAAEAALVQYANLVDGFGGSQSQLIAAIRDLREGQGATDTDETPPVAQSLSDAFGAARARMFEGARAITRREYGVQLAIFAYHPRPRDANRIDCITAMGLIAIRQGESAMPICPVTTFAQGRPGDSPDETVIGPLGSSGSSMPVGRLDEFCSRPLPGIVARRRGGRAPIIVDPAGPPGEPFDVMLGTTILGAEHPAVHEPRMQTCSIVSDGPSRRLVLAVHMHRSLAMSSVATAGVYVRERIGTRMPGPAGTVDVATPEDRWFDRLPDVPRLEYLGLGLDRAGTPAYPRMGELTQHLFVAQSWAPEEFVGFRIEVEYPIWNAQYVVNFEFPGAAPG